MMMYWAKDAVWYVYYYYAYDIKKSFAKRKEFLLHF
jgi:hypothetical protein